MSTAFAARASRQSCVLAAIAALHAGAFLAVAAGLRIARLELPPAPAPLYVLPRPEPLAALARPEPVGAPQYAPPVADQPVVDIPRDDDRTPAEGAIVAAGGEGGSGSVLPRSDVQPPSLRTRDQRLAAMIDACYPSAARRMGREGRVSAVVTIDAAGRAGAWRIDEGSGYPPLDNAVGCVLRRLEFAPGRRDGRAVEAAVRLPIVFRLD